MLPQRSHLNPKNLLKFFQKNIGLNYNKTVCYKEILIK